MYFKFYFKLNNQYVFIYDIWNRLKDVFYPIWMLRNVWLLFFQVWCGLGNVTFPNQTPLWHRWCIKVLNNTPCLRHDIWQYITSLRVAIILTIFQVSYKNKMINKPSWDFNSEYIYWYWSFLCKNILLAWKYCDYNILYTLIELKLNWQHEIDISVPVILHLHWNCISTYKIKRISDTS